MTYFLAYFGTGWIVVIAMLLHSRHSGKKQPRTSIAPPSDVAPTRGSWLRRTGVLDHGGAWCVVALGWPLLLLLMAWPSWKPPPPLPPFAVRSQDLGKQLDVAEIERLEQVNDPLQAVPDQAFGHLHSAWVDFLAEVQPNDYIWTFSAMCPTWAGAQRKSGYVIVTDGKIGRHFTSATSYLSKKELSLREQA